MNLLAGLDLGTTGCKAMVFDSRGNILGEHYIEYELIFTPEGVEQDANLWWQHAQQAFIKALQQAGGGNVVGIGICSQGIASVAVNAEGLPLENAVSWYDQRAEEQARQMAQRYGAGRLFETTGRQPASYMFPQVLWAKQNKPQVYQKAAHYLMPHDYLVYRLCGRAVTDYSLASGTLCFDVKNHSWIKKIFDDFDIDIEKFPAVERWGRPAGRVLPQVARQWGLAQGAVVAVGMQDQKAAALGAGIASGVLAVSLGTAGAVSSLVAAQVADPGGRVACHGFGDEHWILEGAVGTAGGALKWLRDTFFKGVSYPQLDEMAAQSPIGAGGVTFYPEMGLGRGAFTGISLATKQGDVVRAVLEGVALGLRRCIQQQAALMPDGQKPKELLVFGGGAGSGLWCSMIADCTGLPVKRPRTKETGNLGAALCAGVAAGMLKSEDERRVFTGRPESTFTPNEGAKDAYDQAYRRYIKMAAMMEGDGRCEQV